jgi:hypothetical protein
MSALSVRGLVRPKLVGLLIATLLVAGAAGAAAAADPIVVMVDQARIVNLPARAATIVIGNPLIADMAIQSSGIAVLTGKGYGATNVIVMDRGGTVLMEKTIEVTGPSDRTVVVYRGADRETYSCTPICSRRITLGDVPEYFDKTLSETTSRNTQAMAAGASSGR